MYPMSGQRHHLLQVHAWKFMAPSPGPGDLWPACHSLASFIWRPPSVGIIHHPRHPRGLPVCFLRRNMNTQGHAPLLVNFSQCYVSSVTGPSANGVWASQWGSSCRVGVGALTQGIGGGVS